MSTLRHVAVPVCLLVLAVPAGAAAQSGAADNQYRDPFGSSGPAGHRHPSGQGQRGPRHPSILPGRTGVRHRSYRSSVSTPVPSGATLTPAPPTSPSSGSGSPGTSGASGSAGRGQGSPSSLHRRSAGAPPAASIGRQGLPSTGFDLPAIALLGAGLLVCGVGLRLRTIDVRRF
ncbi:MAG TPA: hypothetical protein VGN69_02820 [Solirubrobacteraceae bacterium]|nr:hypothetical protein [Solirubrobacteraceae bacterium]